MSTKKNALLQNSGVKRAAARQPGDAREPGVAQPKAATSSWMKKQPAPPPAFRPQPAPAAAQPKAVNAARDRKHLSPPPVYRPQPVPKVLQTKAAAPATKATNAPPVYRPQPAPRVLQPKDSRTTTDALGRQSRATARAQQVSGHKPAHAPQPPAGVKPAPGPKVAAAQSRAAETVAARAGQRAARPQPVAMPRAVQRMSPPGSRAALTAIQMMAVVGEIDPGEEGRGEHHPYYKFKIGGGESVTHDLDPWITRTTEPIYLRYDNFIGRERKSLRKRLNKVINAWDGSKSIIHALLGEFYGVTTEIWTDWDINVDAIGMKSVDARYSLVRQLLSLQENIRRRERDIPANCYNVDLLTEPRIGVPTTERIVIGWTTILKEARLLLKAQMKNAVACPDGPHDITLLQTAVQNTNDPGIVRLKNLERLSDTMQLDQTPRRVGHNRYTATQVGAKSFNFGYGHIRFILFLEWRIVDDLRSLFA